MQISCNGDYGDVIMGMGVIQEIMGGPHTIYMQHSPTNPALQTSTAICRFQKTMSPLLESQDYITSFRIHSGEVIDWDMAGFRSMGLHYSGVSLLETHAMHLSMVKNGAGKNIRGDRKWLHITPSMETRGMVVINRTSRYNNQFFPWKKIVQHYKGRIVFIGLKHEHQAFCNENGRVSWRQTSDMLEMAHLIAGSELFIGNQSSSNALCEGMKHNLIQETCLQIPDCIFRRPNAQHVADGKCILPDVSGSGVLEIPPYERERYVFRTHRMPPDGWQYAGKRTTDWNALLLDVKRLPEFRDVDSQAMASVVMAANWERKPDFFRDDSFPHLFHTFTQALKSASSV